MPPFNPSPASSSSSSQDPQSKVEKEKFNLATFNPSKYERIEDMPEEARGYFMPVPKHEGKGFRPNRKFEQDRIRFILQNLSTNYVSEELGKRLGDEELEPGIVYEPWTFRFYEGGMWFDGFGDAVCFTNKEAEEGLLKDKDKILQFLPKGKESSNTADAEDLILARLNQVEKSFFEDPNFTAHILSTFSQHEIAQVIPKELVLDKSFVSQVLDQKFGVIDGLSFKSLAREIPIEHWYDVEFRDKFLYRGGNSAYEYFPEDLRADSTVFLSAVFPRYSEVSNYHQIGLYYNAPKSIKDNLEVQREIIRQYGGYGVVFSHLSDEQKKDGEFILNLLDPRGSCPASVLEYVSQELLSNNDFLFKIDQMQKGTSWVGVSSVLEDINRSRKDPSI